MLTHTSISRRIALGSVAAVSALAFGASSASATPTGDYADFAHCPLSNPSVTNCLVSTSTSGSFKLGNADVPINKTIKLQGGVYADAAAPTGYRFVNAVGADTLSKTALDVPGGLLGLVVPSQITAIPILGPLFTAAVNATNGVQATAELTGPVGYDFIGYVTGGSTAVSLPVRIKLDNPFLGSECYVGSAAHPVMLNLTTGTTAPPAPNTPVTGNKGALQFLNGAQLIVGTGNKLVDNAFAVPAAQDCGPWGFQWAVTPIVNLKEGYPSAAGKNSATLQGNLKTAAASAVRASE